MPDKPVSHGYDHRPGGFDATITGPWHNVSDGTSISAWDNSTDYDPGDTVTHDVFVYLCVVGNTNVEPNSAGWANYWIIDVPLFQNSWVNSGGTLAPMRYKLSIGPPHVLDKDDGSILDYSDHQIEIQGSASSGTTGSIIFWLPLAYAPDAEVRLAASDDVGGFTPLTVKADGSVWKGIG